MLQTLFVYISLAFLMFFLVRKSMADERKMSWSYWLAMLLFTLVFGMRYGVGIDYNAYLDIYEDWDYLSTTEYGERVEPGFQLVIYLCRALSLDVVGYFSILAFLQIFFLFLAFRDAKEPFSFMCLTLIFTGLAMVSFMNGIRQNIAFCIFIFAIRYIESKSFFKYLLLIALATLFHKSAVILLPLYFVWMIKREWFSNVYVQLVLLLLSFCVVFINPIQAIIGYVDDFIVLLGYDDYLDSDRMEGARELGMTDMFQLLIYVIIILQSGKMKKYFQSDFFNILYDLFFIGVCLGYVFIGSMMFGRVILYFTNISFIMLGYVLAYLHKTWRYSLGNVYSYVLLILFVGVLFGRIMLHASENTTQYVFYFQEELHDMKDMQREEKLNNN